MGDPRRIKKQYVKPRRPFETDRFESELKQVGAFGLRNKREFWRHRSELSAYRRQARYLLGLPSADRVKEEKELIDKLTHLGILKTEPTLDNVLDLTLPDVLERRLQTIVFRKGFACSMYHARQLVVHGHISLGPARVQTPSRVISVAEEDSIGYSRASHLNDPAHPARVAASEAAKRVSMAPQEEPEPEMETRPPPSRPRRETEEAEVEPKGADIDMEGDRI